MQIAQKQGIYVVLDDNTFDSLVQRYRLSLTRVAYNLCGDREAAYDIVQETLVDAYRGFAGLSAPEKAGVWLYAILRRKAAAHRLTRKPNVELLEENIAAKQDDGDTLARMIFTEQISKLNKEDREILAGKYLMGLSYKELAESLGIKEGAVRVRSLRAKERLGDILRGVSASIPGRR